MQSKSVWQHRYELIKERDYTRGAMGRSDMNVLVYAGGSYTRDLGLGFYSIQKSIPLEVRFQDQVVDASMKLSLAVYLILVLLVVFSTYRL